MKTFKILTFLSLICMVCMQSCVKDKCENLNIYTYNSNTGKCENCDGIEGYNEFDVQNIQATSNAECLNLSGKKLVYLLDTSKIENFNEFGNNQIIAHNFKGCQFDSAQLFFNDILNGDLEGANLSKIEYGYAIISGHIDEHTILPNGCPAIANDSLYCVQ